MVVLRCIQGFVDRGHLFVELPVEEVVVHNVAWYVGAGGASRASDLARALSVLAGLTPEAYQAVLEVLGSSGLDSVIVNERHVVNAYHTFLVDTGASVTMINARLIPSVMDAISSSLSRLPAGTAGGVVYVASGEVVLGGGAAIPVTINPYMPRDYHLLGVDALRALLGDRILLDFEEGLVCGLD